MGEPAASGDAPLAHGVRRCERRRATPGRLAVLDARRLISCARSTASKRMPSLSGPCGGRPPSTTQARSVPKCVRSAPAAGQARGPSGVGTVGVPLGASGAVAFGAGSRGEWRTERSTPARGARVSARSRPCRRVRAGCSGRSLGAVRVGASERGARGDRSGGRRRLVGRAPGESGVPSERAPARATRGERLSDRRRLVGRAARGERPGATPSRPERPARAERGSRGERSERPTPSRAERPTRAERPARAERGSRGERSERSTPSRAERPARPARAPKPAHPGTTSPRYGGGSPGRRGYEVTEDWGGGAGRGRSSGRYGDIPPDRPSRGGYSSRSGSSRTTGSGGGIGGDDGGDYRISRTRRR